MITRAARQPTFLIEHWMITRGPMVNVLRARISTLAGAAVCIAMVALWPGRPMAQTVDIKQLDCNNGVRLVARQAPLQDVLRQLARTLDFQLQFDGSDGALIDIDATRLPVELVGLLSPQESTIVTQARDPRCPGRNRIVKVWVLSAKQTIARDGGGKAIVRETPPGKPVFEKERVVRGTRELDEESRRLKAAYDEYVRTHGVPPPGVEEEAAKN